MYITQSVPIACRTRQEFREWMVREAGPFPYSLSFHDIGKAEFTGEALQKLPRHLQHADVGGSTQVASPPCMRSFPLLVPRKIAS